MKTAVVTDASSGMGWEAVTQIADRFGGTDETRIATRRKERLKELGGHVPVALRCFGLDVTDSDDLKVLKMALKENKPDMRLLINSVGYGKIGSVGDVCLEDETDVIQVNCQTLYAVTRMAPPYMGKNSRILQSASSAAFLPQPHFTIYMATKSFVLSYSHTLGAELKNQGILVTAVYPSPAKIELFDIAETTGHIPLHKRLAMVDPRKVVRLTLRDSMVGEPLSIYEFTMRGSYVLSKILPYGWLSYLMTHMKFQSARGASAPYIN